MFNNVVYKVPTSPDLLCLRPHRSEALNDAFV